MITSLNQLVCLAADNGGGGGNSHNSTWEPVSRHVVDTIYKRLLTLSGGTVIQKSIRDLEADLGYSQTTIQRAINALENEGKIRHIKTAPDAPEQLEIVGVEETEGMDELRLQAYAALEQLPAGDLPIRQVVNSCLARMEILNKQAEELARLKRAIVSETDTAPGVKVIIYDFNQADAKTDDLL